MLLARQYRVLATLGSLVWFSTSWGAQPLALPKASELPAQDDCTLSCSETMATCLDKCIGNSEEVAKISQCSGKCGGEQSTCAARCAEQRKKKKK